MAVSIVSCPHCKALLLSDTAQCPECNHVLDPELAAKLSARTASEQQNEPVAEDPCPNCGEMVRRGLVRCWNCSAFMRRDIADAFRKMTDAPRPVIYSQRPHTAGKLPAASHPAASAAVPTPSDLLPQPASASAAAPEPTPAGPMPVAPAASPSPSSSFASGGAVTDAADEDFELAPDVQAVSELYALATPVAEVEPAEVASAEAPPVRTVAETALTAAAAGAAPAAPPVAPAEDESAIPHSEATAGDVLLQTALAEQAEAEKRRAQMPERFSGGRSEGKAGFVLVCPCEKAVRIRVQERHRGRPIKCPRCAELLVVPQVLRLLVAPKDLRERFYKAEEELAAKRQQEALKKSDRYKRWLYDAHVHAVQPEKLKLKPGSLEHTFEPLDFGFLPEGILAVKLFKRPVVGRGADKKNGPLREQIVAHLQEEKPRDQLPVFAQAFFPLEVVRKIRIVQPVRAAHESMFAGVPVFGAHRIALRFPEVNNPAAPQFVSLSLSEFRRFRQHLVEQYDWQEFGDDCDVPLKDSFTELKCHYTDQPLRVLNNLEYYQNDPEFKLQIIGYKCQACGLTISEDGRKKENLGGKNPKGLAKTKCPKCPAKFGYQPLYGLETPPQETHSDGGPPPADSTAAEAAAELQPAAQQA